MINQNHNAISESILNFRAFTMSVYQNYNEIKRLPLRYESKFRDGHGEESSGNTNLHDELKLKLITQLCVGSKQYSLFLFQPHMIHALVCITALGAKYLEKK